MTNIVSMHDYVQKKHDHHQTVMFNLCKEAVKAMDEDHLMHSRAIIRLAENQHKIVKGYKKRLRFMASGNTIYSVTVVGEPNLPYPVPQRHEYGTTISDITYTRLES